MMNRYIGKIIYPSLKQNIFYTTRFMTSNGKRADLTINRFYKRQADGPFCSKKLNLQTVAEEFISVV